MSKTSRADSPVSADKGTLPLGSGVSVVKVTGLGIPVTLAAAAAYHHTMDPDHEISARNTVILLSGFAQIRRAPGHAMSWSGG